MKLNLRQLALFLDKHSISWYWTVAHRRQLVKQIWSIECRQRVALQVHTRTRRGIDELLDPAKGQGAIYVETSFSFGREVSRTGGKVEKSPLTASCLRDSKWGGRRRLKPLYCSFVLFITCGTHLTGNKGEIQRRKRLPFNGQQREQRENKGC